MPRVLVMWIDPSHLSKSEAEDWVRAECERLRALEAAEDIALTRLVRPSEGHAQPWDWLLEVHLARGCRSAGCVEDPVFADWLRDLRLLGMHPAVVAEDGA